MKGDPHVKGANGCLSDGRSTRERGKERRGEREIKKNAKNVNVTRKD